MYCVLFALAALFIESPAVGAFTLNNAQPTLARSRKLSISMQSSGSQDPLLLRAARGEKVERVPVWMMRQAGRHMKAYRELCKTYKTFRERSEIAEVATEIR